MSKPGNNGIDPGPLKAFVERIERLTEEKKAISDDIREVYAEAKSSGFDSKIMRRLIARRKKNADTRREEDELMTLYMSALGMQMDLPL